MREEPLPASAIQVAVVGRPHGVRGELRVLPESGDPRRLARLERAWLRLPDGTVLAAELDGVRAHGEFALVLFGGVASRDDAEGLVHAEMWALEEDLPARGRDAFSVREVLGAELVDVDVVVGRVTGVASSAGRDYFEVDAGGRTVLVPAVKEWLIAREPGRIVMRLPAGLLDAT